MLYSRPGRRKPREVPKVHGNAANNHLVFVNGSVVPGHGFRWQWFKRLSTEHHRHMQSTYRETYDGRKTDARGLICGVNLHSGSQVPRPC